MLECSQRTNDIRIHTPAGTTKSRARATLAGAIIAAIADLLLLLLIGVTEDEGTGKSPCDYAHALDTCHLHCSLHLLVQPLAGC